MLGIILGIVAFIAFIILLIHLVLRQDRWPQSRHSDTSKRAGERGEEIVYNTLIKVVGQDAKIINNYMFRGETISVQIDHVVVNYDGVFVIETKNYSGYIYGKAEDKEWTQVLADGNVKNQFRNPIRQNAGHIYQLSKILPKGTPFHNIVVMVQGNTENIRAEGVVSPQDLDRAINSVKPTNHLNLAQINRIYEVLMRRAASSEVSEEQHVREINQMLADVDRNICPRCKGELVIREGKYGKFYGCSNYPKCTFKKKCE